MTELLKKIITKISLIKVEYFVCIVVLIFYFLLWYINPGNKIIAFAFSILFLILYFRIKDFRVSILITYVSSMIIFTGKTYHIQLIPAGIYSEEIYPSGYVVPFIISPKLIIAFLMLVILLRDLIHSKFRITKFRSLDLILIFFFIWTIISDIFGSKKPEISILFSLTSIESLILYLYFRTYIQKYPKIPQFIFWIFVSMIIFESAISLQQYVLNSPIFKNIEHQVDIVYFGRAADELMFKFRPLGTFPHANILAAWFSYLLSILLVCLYKNSSYFLKTIFIMGLTVLIITISRSSWLGILISIMLILYIGEKVKKIRFPNIIKMQKLGFLALGFFLLIFFVLPRAEKSLYSFVEGEGGGFLRLSQIQDTIALIKQYPVLGVGSAMSVQEGLSINPRGIYSLAPITIHNWYLLVAAEHGLPALILFSIFVIISIKKLAIAVLGSRMLTFNEYIMLGAFGGIMAILVIGFFQNFLVLNLVLMTSGLFLQTDVNNNHNEES